MFIDRKIDTLQTLLTLSVLLEEKVGAADSKDVLRKIYIRTVYDEKNQPTLRFEKKGFFQALKCLWDVIFNSGASYRIITVNKRKNTVQESITLTLLQKLHADMQDISQEALDTLLTELKEKKPFLGMQDISTAKDQILQFLPKLELIIKHVEEKKTEAINRKKLSRDQKEKLNQVIHDTFQKLLFNFGTKIPPLLDPQSLSAIRQALSQAAPLSDSDKLAVIAHLKAEVSANPNTYSSEVQSTLRAAEHLIRNRSSWLDFANRVRANQVDNKTYVREIFKNFHLLSHPANNSPASLASFIETFADGLVHGYVLAVDQGKVDNFISRGLEGVCFEAKCQNLQNWILQNSIEDAAIHFNYTTDDNHYQILGNAVAPFIEMEARKFYEREILPKLGRGHADKMSYLSREWEEKKVEIKTKIEFYQKYCTRENFVKFLVQKLPIQDSAMPIGKPCANTKEISKANVREVVDEFIKTTEVEIFEFQGREVGLEPSEQSTQDYPG
jgi:hypothetical protein